MLSLRSGGSCREIPVPWRVPPRATRRTTRARPSPTRFAGAVDPVLCGRSRSRRHVSRRVAPHQYGAVAPPEVNEPDIARKVTDELTGPPTSTAGGGAGEELPSDVVATDVASGIHGFRTAQRAVEFLQLDPFLSPNQVLAATTVAVEPDTGLVAITAKAPTARDSARIANALGRGYVDLRENYDLERIRRTRRRLERLASRWWAVRQPWPTARTCCR